MSGFGGFGFGQSNQQQQTASPFGASTSGGGFGNTGATSGSGFGSGFGNSGTQQNTSFSGGFGSGAGTTGGFGGTTNSPFGKPAFGSTTTTTGGGLFGSTTATSGSGFGGFGGANTSSAFGSGTTGAGLFGQSKPAGTFGTGTTGTTGGSLFGGGGTTGGFGQTNTGGFGQSTTTPAPNFGPSQPCPGTGNTPFQAFAEKDAAAGQTANYQSITFMEPYKNWSFEELRLADYNQGRKFGNPSGGTGFGATGFGGATTGNNLFGQSSSASPFGQSTTATSSGFGGGLFGSQQNKPATGLFGSTTTTSGQQTGGVFGTSGTTGFGGTGTGFGTQQQSTGTGLFGQQQNQTQDNKPAFGGFGTSTNTGSTGAFGGGGFGTSTTNTGTSGGLFGQSNTGTAGFGQQQQTSNPFGSSFGQNQQSQQQGQTGGGLFGNLGQNNQPKPSLFGTPAATNTGGGLLGSSQPQQNTTGTGLFGNSQQQSGGIFGNKPASTGTSLFGATSTTPATGGGLFGNSGQQNQQQNQTGGGLFGNLGQNNQQKPSLFGAAPSTNTGTGLFGNSQQQQQPAMGGSLFNQPQQQSTMGGSLFGNSQPQQQQVQQPQSLTASLMTANPYGNEQLFSSLATPSQSVGPLATPLSSSQKMRKSAILPQHKINPQASTRLITPQKRTGAYGFSYSTYGTPGSAASNASPGGFGNSLFASNSFTRSLGKSFSTTNLRNSFTAGDSILAPGAFTATNNRSYAQTGSMRRLNINRNLKTDLFALDSTPPAASILKKKVSFEQGDAGDQRNGDAAHTGAQNDRPSAIEQGLIRPQPKDDAAPAVNGAQRPEPEQVRGNELAIVPENGSPEAPARQEEPEKPNYGQTDKQLGPYWSKPSIAELKNMPKDQLKNFQNFEVGRQGAGKIIFSRVDLTSVPLDRLFDDIVVLTTRSATVYGGPGKPPRGQGLNVPSTITLENSWPRAKRGQLPVFEKKGPRFERHIARLKAVEGTEFVDYDEASGRWTFKVQHYTTYAMPGDDEDMESSMLSEGPMTPTPKQRTPGSYGSQMDVSMMDTSSSEHSPDDTFNFKRPNINRRKVIPGGFGDEQYVSEEEEADHDETMGTQDNTQQSILDERSIDAPEKRRPDEHDRYSSEEEDAELMEAENDITDSFPGPMERSTRDPFTDSINPKSILKASTSLFLGVGTPGKAANVTVGGDWAQQLQRTVSPRKLDRQALKESQAVYMKDREASRFNNETSAKKPKLSTSAVNNKQFRTSIDIMNSLFGNDVGQKPGQNGGTAGKTGFQV